MAKRSISEKYFKVLMAYVDAPDEKYLVEAAELGRELVTEETPHEEIAEMHEEALARLAENVPDMTLIESTRTISAPLMELLMAYGLAFRERTEACMLSEEKLQNRSDHLEELVKARTSELEAFTYSMSHDLRAPLRSMQGLAQALLEDYGEGLDKTGKDYAQRIVNAAQRMDVFILDLLAYSRLSRSDPGRRPVSLDLEISRVMGQLEAEIGQSNARVTVEKTPSHVMAEPATLQLALTNLLTNAIKFVAPGIRPQIRVVAEERNERVRVEDNGIGIAPEYQERIFNVFERLHGIESYPGTGIGLALVKKGVERMGGKVGLESASGKGSRFWIELDKAEVNR